MYHYQLIEANECWSLFERQVENSVKYPLLISVGNYDNFSLLFAVTLLLFQGACLLLIFPLLHIEIN